MPGTSLGQRKRVVASIVIAEEEADEAGVALIRAEAVTPEVVIAEAPSQVEAQDGQGSQSHSEANPVAAQQRPRGGGREGGAAKVGEQPALNLREIDIPERRAQGEMGEQ